MLLLCFLALLLHGVAAAAPAGSPTNHSAPPPPPINTTAAPVGAPSNTAPPPSPPVQTFSNATELAALLSLKAYWSDPAGHLADWSAANATSLCSWRGVTCNANFSIVSLRLPALSLSGVLSPAIANLSSLSVINLSFNNFSGLLPPQLGTLSSLSSLILNHNLFNGTIPSSLFLSSSLQYLLLDNNHLSDAVPSSIANLANLRYLSLQSNSLNGPLLSSLTNLRKLSAIFAASNQFNGTIPPQIGSLSRLIYLDLSFNALTGFIPSSIGSLTKLKDLVLNDNQLEGPLPAELGNLHAAIAMNLSHNLFNGTIPPHMGNLSSLQELDLCNNYLEGNIPPSLGNLTMLKSLNLSFNNLSGEIPTNGALAKFNYTSYEGNGLLCGGDPFINMGCGWGVPPGGGAMPDYARHRMPYGGGTSMLGKNAKVTIEVLGGAFGLVVVLVVVVCCCNYRGRRNEEHIERSVERGRNSFSIDVAESMRKAKLEVYMEAFTHNYEEIVSHAGYFDTAHVLGKGRFATVYKSDLPSGKHLAVKVFNNPITQSTFERELALLRESASHVTTLLPIRGYYANPIEKAIFYDYMPKGTLFHVLHHSPSLLDWPKRLNIALGVAQALDHLHSGTPSALLHKDLKSSNILLDDEFNPLVSDYGLIDLVSKTVVETPGYTPPEFTTLSYSVRRYTRKTDTYSFGVVLLELLSGKSPVSSDEDMNLIVDDENHTHPKAKSQDPEQDGASQDNPNDVDYGKEEEFVTRVHLVTWVLGLHKQGQGLEVLHPLVVESCPSPDHRLQALNLAILCIDDEPAQRPSMLEIISILEGLASNVSPLRNLEHQSRRPLLK